MPGKTHPPTPMDQNQEPHEEPDGDEEQPADGMQPHPAYDKLQAEAQKSGAHIHPMAQLGGLDHDGASKVLKRDGHTDINGHTQNLDIKPIQDTPHHATICTHCQNGEGSEDQNPPEGQEGEGGNNEGDDQLFGQGGGQTPPRIGDPSK